MAGDVSEDAPRRRFGGGRSLLVIASFALTLGGCASSRARAASAPSPVPTSDRYVECRDPDCRSFNVRPVVAERVRYGFACAGDVGPGRTPNPVAAPIEYDARDVGKPGFPPVSPDELRVLERIEATHDSPTLKIAWIGDDPPSARFIVFDDTDAPCTGESLGFPVLDGGCNEYYKPGENPYRTFAAPGESIPACREPHGSR